MRAKNTFIPPDYFSFPAQARATFHRRPAAVLRLVRFPREQRGRLCRGLNPYFTHFSYLHLYLFEKKKVDPNDDLHLRT